MGSGSSSASNRTHANAHAHVSARSGAHVPTVQCVAVQTTLQPSSSDLYDHSHAEQERASAISRVAALEARIKELEAENASLKGRAPAAPSACPVDIEQPPIMGARDVDGRGPDGLAALVRASVTLRRVHLIHHAGLPRSYVAKRIEAHSAQRTEHTARVQLLHTKFDSSHAFRTRLAPIVEARASVHAMFELIMKSDEDGLRQALLQGADPNVVDGCVFGLFCFAFRPLTPLPHVQPGPVGASSCAAQEAHWLHRRA